MGWHTLCWLPGAADESTLAYLASTAQSSRFPSGLCACRVFAPNDTALAFAPIRRCRSFVFLSGAIPRPTMGPQLVRLYEQLPDPKWALSLGQCANSGGEFYDSYDTVQGVDMLVPVGASRCRSVPVAVFVPGCPPRPEALIEGILSLRETILKPCFKLRGEEQPSEEQPSEEEPSGAVGYSSQQPHPSCCACEAAHAGVPRAPRTASSRQPIRTPNRGRYRAPKSPTSMTSTDTETGRTAMPRTTGTLRARPTMSQMPSLVRDKLTAFDRMARAFQTSFAYVEQMHGERRFPRVPVAATVRYLHALWLCDCKDALLSVPLTVGRYDQHRALGLLLAWQEGATADVVAFLEHKLDLLPFAQLTRRLHVAQREVQQLPPAAEDAAIADRLRHGRAILVNRGMNLHRALDAIFTLSPDQLVAQVREACALYGHSPEQIREQLALPASPLYSYLPHPELARRNMRVMNHLGVCLAKTSADRPGGRTARVSRAEPPLPAYAMLPLAHQATCTPPPYSTSPYYPIYPLSTSLSPPPHAVGGGQAVVHAVQA